MAGAGDRGAPGELGPAEILMAREDGEMAESGLVPCPDGVLAQVLHWRVKTAERLFLTLRDVVPLMVLAVILTGMGHDGTKGAADIVAQGGSVIAQDEATSVVWGMPGSAANAAVALWVDGLAPGLVLRALTGVCMAGVYPPAMKIMATWFREGRGLAGSGLGRVPRRDRGLQRMAPACAPLAGRQRAWPRSWLVGGARSVDDPGGPAGEGAEPGGRGRRAG